MKFFIIINLILFIFLFQGCANHAEKVNAWKGQKLDDLIFS